MASPCPRRPPGQNLGVPNLGEIVERIRRLARVPKMTRPDQPNGFAHDLDGVALNGLHGALRRLIAQVCATLGLAGGALAVYGTQAPIVEALWTWPASLGPLGSVDDDPFALGRQHLRPGEPCVLLPLAQSHRWLVAIDAGDERLGLAEFAASVPFDESVLGQLEDLVGAVTRALVRLRRDARRARLLAELDQNHRGLVAQQVQALTVAELGDCVHDVSGATQVLREISGDFPPELEWRLRAVLERLDKAVARGAESAHAARQRGQNDLVALGDMLNAVVRRVRHLVPEAVQLRVLHRAIEVPSTVPAGVQGVLTGLALQVLAVPGLVGSVTLEAERRGDDVVFHLRSALAPSTIPASLVRAARAVSAVVSLEIGVLSLAVPVPRVGERDRSTPSEVPVVLAVDDEALILQVIERILARQGYLVLLADSGTAALEVAEAHAGHIDLLLTDIVLPDISGKVLHGEIAKHANVGATLFMSGFSGTALRERGVTVAMDDILTKPFLPSELVSEVQARLGIAATK